MLPDQLCNKNEVPDLIHLFVITKKEFESEMKRLDQVIKKNQEDSDLGFLV